MKKRGLEQPGCAPPPSDLALPEELCLPAAVAGGSKVEVNPPEVPAATAEAAAEAAAEDSGIAALTLEQGWGRYF